ncbi:MAG: KdsC family phosphatase [Gaiellaceae bacterium]
MSRLEPALARLRLAVFDFDGVFTDNRVWTNQHGEESVACSRSDGLGLRRLDEVGVGYLIVSTEANPVVAARARKLGAECFNDAADKLAIVIEQAERLEVGLDEVAYVGNDVNDVHCLKAVGLPVVPADAWPEVVPLARWVLTRKGGEGCVREFCDEVWRSRGGGDG